ncbi:UPF0056 inner membrane protein [Prolixibacter sp. SD074]|nr:UPF0056 inner membrane protein [Prolixibacter sp. SD074]
MLFEYVPSCQITEHLKPEFMQEIYSFGLLALTSFFTLFNPLGTMPIFVSMTSELSEEQKRKTARKAVVVAFITILVFAFSGQLLFRFFGISVNSFRIVGGVIFFLMGQDMLQARLGKIKMSEKESEINAYVNDISITPLAIPMISGPGSITNGIVLMEDASTFWKKLVLVGSIALILALTYVILVSGTRISKKLGPTGNNVLMRLMGLIVMVIAVEFFFSGLKPIVQDMIK